MANGIQYFYPLTIISDLDSISLTDSLVLRKITIDEIKVFFGIENRQLSTNHSLSSCNTIVGGYYPLGDTINHIASNTIDIFSCNYVLVSKIGALEAHQFNEALKLLYAGKTGVYLGFNSKSPAIEFIYPNPFFKTLKLLVLNKANQNELIRIFTNVKKLTNIESFQLLMELYQSSISGHKLRNETRFVELMTLLEILYLGNNDGELKYRLSVRIAKTLTKYYKEEIPTEVFDFFSDNKKGLYAIRSEIVHKGKSSKLTDYALKKHIDYVRKSLLLYLDNQEIYTPRNQDKLVLS